MKKYIFILIASLYLFSCSGSGISLPSGVHGFDECFGLTAGGSPICFEWSIQQIDKKLALVNVDGFQTYERLVCSLHQMENILEIKFDSYVESEIQTGTDREKGDVLLRIRKENSVYYAYDIKSPDTGEIMPKEYELLNFNPE